MIRIASWLLAVLFMAQSAFAAPKGQDVLTKMDVALTKAKDNIFTFDMVIQDPGKESREVVQKVYTRGEKRYIVFLSPGDIKGTKMLSISRDKMYVYLPAYRKIRRVASHARSQTLFGADYTYDEMSTVTYADIYQAKSIKETATHYTVDASLRSGKEAPYKRIVFRVRKKEMLPDELRYYSAKGNHIKTETRSEFSCNKGACSAAKLKMVDHTRNDHWTTMQRKTWEVNTGFSERIFSLRNLQRGR
jgi:outer membrane lipoprotein-sorting protein